MIFSVDKMLVAGMELICPGTKVDPLSRISPLSQVGVTARFSLEYDSLKRAQ